jgi:hypothetical protein
METLFQTDIFKPQNITVMVVCCQISLVVEVPLAQLVLEQLARQVSWERRAQLARRV